MSLLLVLRSIPGVTATAPTATVTISGQTPTAFNSIAPVVATAPTAVVSIVAQTPAANPGITPVIRSADAAVVSILANTPTVIMTPPPQIAVAPTATISIVGNVPVALSRLPFSAASPGATIIGPGSTAPLDSIIAEFEGSVIQVERWVDLYEADNITIWRSKVGMTAGSVSVDMARDERRNIDVTLFDADGNIPYGPGGLWYDKIIKPYRGIRLATGDIFVVPLGEFMIDTCNRPHFPGTIQCAGRDFTKKLKLSKFAQTTTFTAGTPIVDVIKAICANGGIDKFNFIASVGVLSEDKSFERGSERWDAAKGLSESINCELFFDANGYLTLRTFVDPLTAPVSFTFNDTNLVDFTRSSNDSLLFNHVVVYGDGPDNPLVYGEAENNNLASPTSVARLGRRTYTRASQFVVDDFQAEQIALSYLRVMGLEQFDMALTTVVIPWLEAGDAIQVLAPDSADVDPARYLLSSFSIPLELGTMNGSAKRITIISTANENPDEPTLPPSTPGVGYPFPATVTIVAQTPTVAVNAATAISETFTTGTTGTDANFTQVRGPLSITSGVLRPGATTTEVDWYHNTNLGTTDHWVEADVVIGASDPGSHFTALVARSNGGTQTGGGGGGGVGTGVFEVSGRNIIDPNGRKLIPVGMNVTAAPTVFPDAWWQNNTYYANGHVAEAVAWGINFVRVFVPYDPDGGPTMEAACAGTTNLINEYTAQGIVCMIIVGPPQSRNGYNPTLATLPQYIVTIQDYIVANHGTNPYVWLNMMGEAWEFVGATSNANWLGWEEVNTHLYNRARQQGWTNPQVFTLGGYGQGIVGAAQGTLYDNWKSGKSNVIFDHHCYGVNGNYDEISQSVAAFIAKGNALIIGEFGEHWNRANGGVSALPSDPLGVQWVKDNAWTAAFGVGGIAWNGAMNHYNVYSMRQNPNKHADTSSEAVNVPLSDYGRAFWHTDQPRSYVGQMLYDQGQLGPTVNGGGAASGTGTGASGNGLTYYSVELAGDRQAITLNKCLDGTYTEIGRWQGTTWNVSETHKLRLEVVGSQITAIVDGVQRIQVTDPSVTSGTRVGVHLYANTSTSTHSLDNFKAGTSGFGGGTPPPPPTQTQTAPNAPTALVATPGNTTVALSWAAPANNGGSPLTDYEVWRGVVVSSSGASFSTLFSTAGGASVNGLAETPGNGLHGYNVPLSVSGGRARPSAPPGEGYGDCIAFPAQNDIGVNHFARAKIVIGSGGVGSGGTGAYTGVMVRVTPTAGSGYPTTAYSWYKFETTGDSGQVRFLEVINGTLGREQYFPYSIQANQTYEFELSINGTSLIGKINGVTIFSRTEERLVNGKPGVTIYNNVSDQTTIDDFTAGDLSGGTGTQIAWTLISDGVGVGTTYTDTGRTNGTQYSYRVRAKNAIGTSGDSNTVTATPTTTAPPPPPPVSTGDWYIRNGKIGRNGKQFIPIGLNGVAGPRNAPVGDYWNDAGMGNMRGKSAFFVQSGFNFLRINDMYDETGQFTMQDHMNGIIDVIDEYTARGVVCMPSYHKLGQGNNPTPAQLDANADFQWYWQTLIDRYKTNKLVWVNPLNEPLGLQWDQFETSGNYQYNLMRNKGWPGPIVIDLPQWGGAISVAASRGAAFVAGKTLCIIGYHNYGHVTDDTSILNAQAQGVAIINGEYGEEWPETNGKFRASSDWTIANAIRLGTGAVAWWGAGNRNDPYCFYNQMGSAFYDTHLGPLNRYGQRVFNLAANQPPPADL